MQCSIIIKIEIRYWILPYSQYKPTSVVHQSDSVNSYGAQWTCHWQNNTQVQSWTLPFPILRISNFLHCTATNTTETGTSSQRNPKWFHRQPRQNKQGETIRNTAARADHQGDVRCSRYCVRCTQLYDKIKMLNITQTSSAKTTCMGITEADDANSSKRNLRRWLLFGQELICMTVSRTRDISLLVGEVWSLQTAGVHQVSCPENQLNSSPNVEV